MGLLNHESVERIPILDAPGGRTIYDIQNDSAAESFYSLAILGYADGFLLVRPSSLAKSYATAGWVDREHVFVYGRNYSTALNLRAEPSATSPLRSVIANYWPGLYAVRQCHGEWLDVHAAIDGKSHDGWMPREMQCDNPYTTCS